MAYVKRAAYVLASIVVAFLIIGLSNLPLFDPVFGSLDELKRDQPSGSPACRSLKNEPTQLVTTDNVESAMKDDAWRCSLQYHALERDTPGYNLAFLEFNDSGELRSNQQYQDIAKHLEKGRHVLITYIHGWRHDADRDSTEVQNFRIMMAYARQFLSQRCREENRYCDHTLTGLYLAWNGRSRIDCAWQICAIFASPSLFTKKPLSDRLAAPVTAALKKLEHVLRANIPASDSDTEPSRMLVTGHSLGGNILARGVRDDFEAAVDNHVPRQELKSVLGDVVVLFNPASAAKNWTNIQRAVRKRYGVDGTRYRFGSDDQSAYNAHIFFPLSQNPRYVSLTSACEWPEFVTSGQPASDLNRKINCDTTTYYLFRFLRLFRGNKGDEELNTIGHIEPTDKCGIRIDGTAPPPFEKRKLIHVGTTHELEIGAPAANTRDRYTTYKNALDPETSRCDSGAGWLYRAKQKAREQGSPSRTLWDGGATPAESVHWMNRELRLRIQFRHSIYRGFRRSKSCGGFAITTANDPFWNVRALDSAVKDHGRFFSYPTWCALNQLVLDDVSAKDVPQFDIDVSPPDP